MNRIMLRAVAVGTAMMLTAAGCKNDTPSAPINKETPVPVFTGITDLQTYLEGQGETAIDKPIAVRLSVNLSEQETSTENLFAALAAAGKYVDLDLSGCTGLTEWVRYTDAGADRVVSLVLPDSVAEIEGTADAFTFASFASLKAFTANKAETVGAYAFYRHAALKTAILPAATVIGEGAFRYCQTLASVSLPAATAIGAFAFNYCVALASADLPAATTIGTYAFQGCAALASVSLPVATTIGDRAFYGCSALASVSLPAATKIENSAFRSCPSLASANLPAATDIGLTVFNDCFALASANLPAAATIGKNAFRTCYALASLTLGATPPELGATVFFDAGKNTSEGFTVYVPDETARTALEAEITTADSDWYKALKTDDIGAGKYDKVAVMR